MQLTEEQKETVKTFMNFLVNPKEKFMVIQGPAGCGKTTMIKALIDSMNKEYKLLKTLLCESAESDLDIKITATTNKAVAALQEVTNNAEIKTVHSALGLTLKENLYTGEMDVIPTKHTSLLLFNTLLIIDEASMLNTTIFKYIDLILTGKSKAVLIGDIFQLAPVKQRESVMASLLGEVPTVTLGKVLRHDGGILKAANTFRNVVKTTVFENIPLSDKVIHVDGPAFREEIHKAFLSPDYSPDKAKILAWSNDRVQEYNAYIRQILKLPEQFQVGEWVVTNNRIMSILSKKIIPVDSTVRITHIGDPSKNHHIKGKSVTINNTIKAFLPDNYKDARHSMDYLTKRAKSKEMKNNQNAVKQLWTTYFEIKDSWLDLRSQYASTVHKAQGSTYETVFIDLDDIGRCNIASDVARLLYVSLSRASKRIVLSGNLPHKYRNFILA